MKNLLKNFAFVILALFLVAGILSFADFNAEKPENVGISRLVQDINQDKVKSVEVEGDTLTVHLKDEKAKGLQVKKEINQSFTELMSNYGVESAKLQAVDVQVKEMTGWKFWLAALVPYLFPFLLIIGLVYFMKF